MPPASIAAPAFDQALRWRNVRVLAVCQALFVSAMSINLTLTGLVGYSLCRTRPTSHCPLP